ncbi:MAG: hypothetical protein IJY62_02405 [Clostridia bacterium]|nr:hypothetical protein [Clostridia bacterium]
MCCNTCNNWNTNTRNNDCRYVYNLLHSLITALTDNGCGYNNGCGNTCNRCCHCHCSGCATAWNTNGYNSGGCNGRAYSCNRRSYNSWND